jgi:hypothetical protein
VHQQANFAITAKYNAIKETPPNDINTPDPEAREGREQLAKR